MKTVRIIFLTLVLSTALLVKSQNQPGNNLYEFMINYYRDNPYPAEGDTNKRSGFAKDYDRTFAIWGPRLYPHGNFKIAMDAFTIYNQEFSGQNQNTSNTAQ
ncbi:MAG: hypothetical protein Q8L68_02185 [Methylococcales bacterium]|nr:hypothetical protein [Methylococcales bacterium]